MNRREDHSRGPKFSDEKRPLEQCIDPKADFQKKVKQRITERKALLKKMLKEEPPSFLIDSDEKTLKKYVGSHRIIPKMLRTDLVLGRAFRKRNTPREDSLFNIFEKEFIQKGENIYDYLYDGINYDSQNQELVKTDTEEKGGFTMLKRYSSMGKKIAVLETVKKILNEIADAKPGEISSLVPYNEELFVERPEDPEIKETRVVRSPSFERFRSNILHDMYVERRPLSWFKKRCKNFRARNTKKPPGPLKSSPEPIVEEPREIKVKGVMKEAVKDLLALQRSNVYDNFQFPEDILLEKLFAVMRKVSNSMKRIEESQEKCQKKNFGSLDYTESFDSLDKSSFSGNDSPRSLKVEETQQKRLFSENNGNQVWIYVKNMLASVGQNESDDPAQLEIKSLFKKIIDLGKIENYKVFTKYVFDEYQEELEVNCRLEKPLRFADLNEQQEYFHSLSRELLQMIFGEDILPLFPEISLEEEKSIRFIFCAKGFKVGANVCISKNGIPNNLQHIHFLECYIESIVKKEHIFSSFLGWNDDEENLLMSHVQKGQEIEVETSHFETIWKESILTGLCLLNNEVQLMEEGRIIIRSHKEKRVKIMSGGRVGLEPLFSEYVAKGMLDCVVLGDKHNGLSVRTILQAILEISTTDGVVIIILNEFQYRFSFLMAASKAKDRGANVCLIMSRDDASDIENGRLGTERLGSAGIVIQYKIASAMAAEGQPLKAIRRVCNFLCILSISCFIDGSSIYIGHGLERGSGKKSSTTDFLSVSREMLNTLMNPNANISFAPEPDTGIILLINNQGMLEEQIFFILLDISNYLKNLSVKLKRVYVGSFIPLVGKGFTIILAKDWNDSLTKYLDRPTLCNLWPPHTSSGDFCKSFPTRRKVFLQGCRIAPHYHQAISVIFFDFIEGIKLFPEELSDIAKELKHFAYHYLEPTADKPDLNYPFQLFVDIGEKLEKIPGFGKHLALLLYSGSQEFNEPSKIFVHWRMYCEAFYRGAVSLAGYSRYKPGDKSVSDFLFPLAEALYGTDRSQNPLSVMRNALDRLHSTKKLKLHNPGVQFCFYIFEALYNIITKHLYHYSDKWDEKEEKVIIALCGDSSQMKHNFCTEPISSELKGTILEIKSTFL